MTEENPLLEMIGLTEKNPLLEMIHLKEDDIPRFRGCGRIGNTIQITTRTGGGNHSYYDSPCNRKYSMRKMLDDEVIREALLHNLIPKFRSVHPIQTRKKFLREICFSYTLPSHFVKRAHLVPIRKQYKKMCRKYQKTHFWFLNDNKYNGPWANSLRRNPYYIRDYDDDFDCTYCHFIFEVPDQYKMSPEEAKKDSECISGCECRNELLRQIIKYRHGIYKSLVYDCYIALFVLPRRHAKPCFMYH